MANISQEVSDGVVLCNTWAGGPDAPWPSVVGCGGGRAVGNNILVGRVSVDRNE